LEKENGLEFELEDVPKPNGFDGAAAPVFPAPAASFFASCPKLKEGPVVPDCVPDVGAGAAVV